MELSSESSCSDVGVPYLNSSTIVTSSRLQGVVFSRVDSVDLNCETSINCDSYSASYTVHVLIVTT